MNAPQALQRALHELLGDARLTPTALPDCPLTLWLVDPANLGRAFSANEIERILEAPPYWSFCWASGLALAQWLAAHPERVEGKRVLDVGCGSGIVALAAKRAGARQVTACDSDPLALAAVRANAQLNGISVECLGAVPEDRHYDLVVAADVLYDAENRPLLGHFLAWADEVLVADSRVRDLEYPRYRRIAALQACTVPDLEEPEIFRRVSLYHACAT